MFSQTKMQLWYPRTTSEQKIQTYLNGSDKKLKVNTIRARSVSVDVESDISENDYVNVEYCGSDGEGSIFSSRNHSPQHSDCEKNFEKFRKHNSFKKTDEISDFIDLNYWRKENLCCGTIFVGVYGEVMIDPSLIKPCGNRLFKTAKEEESE